MRIDPDPDTVPGALALAARRFGERDAVVDGPVRLTWTGLRAEVRTMSRALLAAGISPGDTVALWAPNTWHWVVAALGALSAGATIVPVNTRFTGTETADVLARARARALVVAGPFLGTDRLAALRAVASGPATVVRVPVEPGPLPPAAGVIEWSGLPGLAERVPEARADEVAAAVRPGHVSDVLFTSGTTGRGKGAASAHAQALAVARAWADRGGLTEADRYLVVNPFFHSFGYKAGILACLGTGAAIVPQRVFDAGATLALVAKERITVLPGPPTVYQSILDSPDRVAHDLASLRLAVTGAAVVPVALVERMRRELTFDTVLTAYGLTEAVVATMCRPEDDDATVATTCGRPTAGFELRITGPDGTVLPPGEPGEVRLRGPNVMLGYLDEPGATAAAVEDGWLHTGDIGVVDERGYLRITDRLKDMYISGGFNVYPAEVEQALARLPGVAESAVFGVPDHRLGEVGLAVVVPSPGHRLAADDVVAFCRSRLANYKVPRRVELRESLPRNAGGKVVKHALRAEYTEGSPGHDG